ncbi:hypothetical protein DXG01_006251 [Tephrocybe rancida]|nr:hypothetical protein DXG01_006251 [Tephrocybe rancida]
MKPELLQERFRDSSTFCASDAFVRKWLHHALGWSPRKGTWAAHKLPDNWEDLCKRSFFRKIFKIKDEDVPPELFVNLDQTQTVYAPGNKMTWAETGAKQVSVLPLQAIYTSKTLRSTPSTSSINYNKATTLGFLLKHSGTATYWSNQETMRNFVDNILSVYFDRQKKALGLPPSQKAIWSIDIWSVHCSLEFRMWMRTHHPNIILDYVPGGCMGVMQPCDVGIQHPFKLSLKQSYHEDIVEEMTQQLDKGKAFEMCTVHGWNLSYASLTRVAAQAQLREMKDTDPEFWKELTQQDPEETLPSVEDVQPEDLEALELIDDSPDDDSNIPISVLLDSLVNEVKPTGFLARPDSTLEAVTNAEEILNVPVPVVHIELGCGKCVKSANRLYSSAFYRHNMDSDSDD